jgi:hypothetical protein
MTDIPPGKAVIAAPGLIFDEDGKPDYVATTDQLNEMLRQGFELLTVDGGVAYWYADESVLLKAVGKTPRKCGFCKRFRDMVGCDKFGFVVMANAEPHREDCFEPLDKEDDEY